MTESGFGTLDDIFQRGLIDHHAGRLQQAELAYTQVLALEPDHAEALHLLGVIAHQVGRDELAVGYIQRSIALAGGAAEARNNLGLALHTLGRLEEAEASFREALRLQPDTAGTYSNLGNVLCVLNRLPEAEECYRRALRLDPDFAEAHNNLGNTLWNQLRSDAAEASYRQALRLRPNYADAHKNLSNMLCCAGRLGEAEAAAREAVRLDPNNGKCHSVLGNVLFSQGRTDAATASYRTALRIRPDDADIHSNLAYLLLLSGRMTEGWDEHEWRWRSRLMVLSARAFKAPQWNGEPIGDRTVLLHAEQGFGDTLQFCRYVPLMEPGAKVILEVDPPLNRLLARLPGVTTIVSRGDALPPFDLQCPLMSLPRAFHTTLDTVPVDTPYLAADAAAVAGWRARLAGLDGLRVGLVWAGQSRMEPTLSALDRRRSVSLARMAPLAEVPGVHWISLQKGEPAVDSKSPPQGMVLHDFTEELDDFDDTAALIMNLDLVISIDSAVVHLAGALGKPVWLLNRFDTCWRWLLGRDDSVWYPTLRQFRQPRPGDWDSVVGRVRDALQRLAVGDRDQLTPDAQMSDSPTAPSSSWPAKV